MSRDMGNHLEKFNTIFLGGVFCTFEVLKVFVGTMVDIVMSSNPFVVQYWLRCGSL